MRKISILFLTMVISLVLAPGAAVARQTTEPPTVRDKAQVETAAAQDAPAPAPAVQKPAVKKVEAKRTELIVPAYSGIREKTAVIVFYAWLWLSIAVLIYFLRLWIKEADRVYKAKYYEPEESPRKDNPMAPVLGD